MIFLKARSVAPGVSSASTCRAISMNRRDCSGLSALGGGSGFRLGMLLTLSFYWSTLKASMFWVPRSVNIKVASASMTNQHKSTTRRPHLWLKEGLFSIIKTISTQLMRRFGHICLFFQDVGHNSRSDISKLIFLSLSVPCFKMSHFFFKLAYFVNQRRLLLLCGEDLFLKVYDCPIADGSIIHILQSLRRIKHSLKNAEAAENLHYHELRSLAGVATTRIAKGEAGVIPPPQT